MKVALQGLLTCLAVAASAAGSGAMPEEPQRCIALSRIDNVDVLDNKRIVFEMVGGGYYLNELPHACPGLRRDSAIMYRTSLSELCDLDVITVLDSLGGGLRPGASCGLGRFHAMEEDEIEAMRRAEHQ